ncbi:MAG TPA: methyl-accepting chemotaxis protein [Symbiobacteriaceae bacterium]|nr:methyl-accepting chemotaxis protein [Symbiobacteriaceae bacterium]
MEIALLTMAAYFEQADGDLTRPFALAGTDPAVLRAEQALQHVIGSINTMRRQLEQMTVTTAETAARSGHLMQATAQNMNAAHERLEQAASGVAVSQTGVAEVARAASQAAELAERTRGVTARGGGVIHGAIDSVTRIQAEISQAQARMAALADRSAQVIKVSGVIEQITKKTHMLSLNAAIEAARAGEMGRGFAVVAADVRHLAESTSRQTQEIRQLLAGMSADLQETEAAIAGGKQEADRGAALATQAGQALDEILELVDRTAQPLGEIATMAEEQSAAMEQASEGLLDVTERTGTVTQQASDVAAMTSSLATMSEAAFSSMGLFRSGTHVDQVRGTAEALAADVRRVLEGVVDRGLVTLDSLLDLTYQEYKGSLVDRLEHLWGDVSRAPRNGFSVPKYATAYDSLVDVELRDLLDRCKEANKGLRFVVLSDLNGYSPAQNKEYCKAWTGDPKTDLHSRVKTMNCDAQQVRSSRMGLEWTEREPMATGNGEIRNMRTVHSRREFLAAGLDLREPAGGDHSVLLQTFARRTGTVVNILSVPIYVKGHRYGAIIVGWLADL